MLFNRLRALEYMRRYEVDVLVATSPINVTYFTDYHTWIDYLFREYMVAPGASSNRLQMYAVFPLEGEPALVVSPESAVNAADLWVHDLHIFGDPGMDVSSPPTRLPETLRRFHDLLHVPTRNATPTDALLSILNARGLSAARIGLEMEGLPPETRAAIKRALPQASITDCTNLIRLIRMVKSTDEIARLTRSAEINEQILMECLAIARDGRPVADLVEHYRARIGEMGADFDHFAFGVRGLGMVTEANYVLSEEDVLFVDSGCIYQHYYSDTGTTLALSEPPAALGERHAALRACLAAGVETIRPGVKSSTVQAAMRQTLDVHGITASYPHGHSFGLEVREYPIIVADNGLRIQDDCVNVSSDLSLEADMVFALEASIFMPGVGSVHIEQSFAVTTEGCRPLVPQDRARPLQPEQGG